MSALLPEALQQLRLLTLRDLVAKQQVRIDLPSQFMGTLTPTEQMHIRNVSTSRILLQIQEDMIYYHHWLHNRTRDTETVDNTLFPMLLASMTAVCIMLVTIMFIWRLYIWSVRAGRATFLIKVKSHRGEPINERADTLAEEGRTISDDDKRWDDRTDRMTFEVQKGDTTVRSVWTNSVRNAFRKQAGWAKLQKVRATAATHWTARVWYRHNQRWLQASKEGAEASKSGSFKDERTWGRKCFEDLDQRRMGRPATSTWSTDFLLREGSSREEIGKWLKNKSIPWRRRRRLLQVVTGTFPCGQQLVKYGYKEKAECILCKKAYEENGGSWKGVLPKETIGHIQSA
jgi:hypothetical protein